MEHGQEKELVRSIIYPVPSFQNIRPFVSGNHTLPFPIVHSHKTDLTKSQLARLETEFVEENYLSNCKCHKLVHELNLPELTIRSWFKQRLEKKKCNLALTFL